MAYGHQLLLDLYECKPTVCEDLTLCYRYLDEVVSHLGMHKQAPPSIFSTDASGAPQHAGLSGWVALIESSVVIHTLVPDAYISVDIYSCKPFDHDAATRFTSRFFEPAKIGSQYVLRGSDLWVDAPVGAPAEEILTSSIGLVPGEQLQQTIIAELPVVPVMPVTTWLAECDPKTWLLEEYKLLSSHYFHEDNQFQTTTRIFATLNGALLAFLGSSFANQDATTRRIAPALGIFLCLAWMASLIRIREWRIYLEWRIRLIEETLHKQWKGADFLPLDIRTVNQWEQSRQWRWFNWPYRAFRNLPSTISTLMLPLAFIVVWIGLLLRALL